MYKSATPMKLNSIPTAWTINIQSAMLNIQFSKRS